MAGAHGGKPVITLPHARDFGTRVDGHCLNSPVSAAYVSNEDLKVKVKYARPALEERQAAERALMPGDPNRLTWRMCNPGGS